MNLSGKQRKILRVVGFVVLALVVFVFALSWTFPYDRVKDRMVEALSAKYDVEISDVKPGIMPGKMIIESMKLTTRPNKKDEKPAIIFLERIEVNIGLLALIGRKLDVEIVASVPGGTVNVDLEESKAGRRVRIKTDGLALGMLPWVKEAVGLPIAGPLHVEANIWLPGKKWKDAEGELSFNCTGCAVGDGKTKLTMSAPKNSKRRRSKSTAIFASQGITVPKIKLGVAEGKLVIKKGVGKFETFGAKSKDGWLKLTDAEVKFADPVGRSTIPGCLRFAFSETLIGREERFTAIRFGWDRVKQEDGSYAFPLKGRLEALRPNVRKRCKSVGGGDDSKTVSSRPTIEVPKVNPLPAKPEVKADIKPDPDPKDAKDAAAKELDPKDTLKAKSVRGISGPQLSTDLMRNGAVKSKEGEEEKKEGENDEGDDENVTEESKAESEQGEGDDEGGEDPDEGEAEEPAPEP